MMEDLTKVRKHTEAAVEYMAVALRELQKAKPEARLIALALELASGNISFAQRYLNERE